MGCPRPVCGCPRAQAGLLGAQPSAASWGCCSLVAGGGGGERRGTAPLVPSLLLDLEAGRAVMKSHRRATIWDSLAAKGRVQRSPPDPSLAGKLPPACSFHSCPRPRRPGPAGPAPAPGLTWLRSARHLLLQRGREQELRACRSRVTAAPAVTFSGETLGAAVHEKMEKGQTAKPQAVAGPGEPGSAHRKRPRAEGRPPQGVTRPHRG